jgi:hypothetical protein
VHIFGGAIATFPRIYWQKAKNSAERSLKKEKGLTNGHISHVRPAVLVHLWYIDFVHKRRKRRKRSSGGGGDFLYKLQYISNYILLLLLIQEIYGSNLPVKKDPCSISVLIKNIRNISLLQRSHALARATANDARCKRPFVEQRPLPELVN